MEVTAGSVYKAVAQGLRIFRENAWVSEMGRGLTTVKVLVKQPEVEHRVWIQDFERWLHTAGKTPARNCPESQAAGSSREVINVVTLTRAWALRFPVIGGVWGE